MSDTKIVRLTSGEEIICKVTHLDGDSILLKDCLVLVPSPKQNGLALVPWMPYTTAKDDGITISMDRTMFIANPHPELAKEHLSAISGLLIPGTAGDVVGTIGPTNLSE